MPFDLWGANSSPYLALPERLSGYLLLAGIIIVISLLFYRQRAALRQQSARQWLTTAGLALSALFLSQLLLFVLGSEERSFPFSGSQSPVSTLAPFSFVPVIIAGLHLHPLLALLVGFASGLGHGMWQTYQILDPFTYALVGWLTAAMMQQNFIGRFFELLRKPYFAAPAALILQLPLSGISAYAYTISSAERLAGLDMAILTMQARFLPLLLEDLIAGIIAALILVGIPTLRQQQKSFIPSPQSQSINRRLISNFLVFAIVLSIALVVAGFSLALRVSTELVIDQMGHNAETVSDQIPDFLASHKSLLVQYSTDSGLLGNDPAARQESLQRLFRTERAFQSVILIDRELQIADFHPQDIALIPLTNFEREAIADTLRSGAPAVSSAQPLEDGSSAYFISFIYPVKDESGAIQGALLGRAPNLLINELISGLQGTVDQAQGFLVDEEGMVLAHPDPSNVLRPWEPNQDNPRQLEVDAPGTAYLHRQSGSNTRELVYYQAGPGHPWTVVTTAPYEVVLGLAMEISFQLAVMLVAAQAVFLAYLFYWGQSVTRPLTALAQAAQRIAGGSLNTPIQATGDDEIGRLGQSFGQMQVALKKRLDELSLLLSISQEVSASMDINQGMPSILQGVLRGTGASGVRVVILNPSGRQPLTFGEGPAARLMAGFDRQIMSLLRQRQELQLTNSEEVSAVLAPDKKRQMPIRSLIALPLATHDRFHGIFWLGYRRSHQFDQTELNLLRTLAGQASVLVENGRLYATAEGGRRRLAAVLASTSDAVIVTDQTERILLINPAMERFFNLQASNVVGRPIAAVIQAKVLIDALTGSAERTRNLEIDLEDRVLYANAAPIFSNEGQAMGRVAVLHDITALKEVDEMKSEFVATVSHDLRSPLTFMRGYATMLPMIAELDEKQNEYVEKILAGIEQMSVLVDNLLDLSRLEAGVDLVVTQFQVRELLASITEEHRQPAESKGIDLVLQSPRDLPVITGDISLIRQAITNYVSNAIKYAPGSGRVTIQAMPERSEVVISVEDNGPGIPQDAQLRLFEKFYRVKQRGTATVKGSGLGLALVKSIAERHGGRAWCESEVGQGSTFFIALPAHSKNGQRG